MVIMLFVVSAIGAVVALAKTVPGENVFVSTAGRWAAMVFPSTVAATAILLLIGYMTKSTWQFIVIDMISPIIGISFTLISVRVNRQKSVNASSNVVHISGNSSDTRRDEIGLGSLPVSVRQEMVKHSDFGTGFVSRDEETLDRFTGDQLKRGY
ncbi:hypothetical protein VKT23_019874 [Stygiomarasmius scandens]|uniref:Uncharacterized protein n=1 Tax=Marasmiellus scandens TaxID=2682957 RepID=A0ABR1IMC9_9AGAR